MPRKEVARSGSVDRPRFERVVRTFVQTTRRDHAGSRRELERGWIPGADTRTWRRHCRIKRRGPDRFQGRNDAFQRRRFTAGRRTVRWETEPVLRVYTARLNVHTGWIGVDGDRSPQTDPSNSARHDVILFWMTVDLEFSFRFGYSGTLGTVDRRHVRRTPRPVTGWHVSHGRGTVDRKSLHVGLTTHASSSIRKRSRTPGDSLRLV